MTATTASREPRRWVHVAARALPLFPVASAALSLAEPSRWTPGWPGIVLAFTSGGGGGGGGGWWTAARFVLTAVTVIAILGWLAHSRMLCPACAARLPLDPQAAAERRRWQLHLTHLLPNRTKLIWILLVLLGLPLLIPTGWPLNAWYVVQDTAAAVLLWSLLTHSALQPWCPWCRRGDDGEPAPAPVPESGRGLPVST
jgi:hypothetical protein